jgi:hypothetical protein
MQLFETPMTVTVTTLSQPLTTIPNISSITTTPNGINLFDKAGVLLWTIDMTSLLHFHIVDNGAKKKRDKRALKPEQVSLIHSLSAKGLTKDAIAKETGVSFRSVKRYLSKSIN